MNHMNRHSPLIDENGQYTKRGIRLTRPIIPLLKRLYARCESAQEARDLKHLVDVDVSIAHSLRVLGLMCGKNKAVEPSRGAAGNPVILEKGKD